MPAPILPATLTNAEGQSKIARTAADYWQLVFDGYSVDGPGPGPDRDGTYARLSDLDALETEILANLPEGFNSEQARDAIAAALLNGGYIDIAVNDGADTITLNVNAEAVQDMLSTFIEAGNSGIGVYYNDGSNKLQISNNRAEIAALFDVITDDRTHGDILVFNAEDNLYYHMPPGGAVGAWETKTVTWTYPSLVETTLAAAVPTSRPSTAQWTRTLTSGDLAAASDAASADPVGFSHVLQVAASVAESGVTLNSLSAELVVNGAVVHSLTDSSGHAAGDRGNINLCAIGVVAGDVVELRVWAGATGGVLDWVGRLPTITRVFKGAPSAGGRWMLRRTTVNSLSTAPTPVTSVGSGSWAANSSGWARIAQSANDSVSYQGTVTTEVTDTNLPMVIPVQYGAMVARLDTVVTNSLAYVQDDASNQPRVNWQRMPASITFDRIRIPTLPV